jgi:hypothetical protein
MKMGRDMPSGVHRQNDQWRLTANDLEKWNVARFDW